MSDETPPLLAKLQAQIDGDKDFVFTVQNVGCGTPEEFRDDCRQIFADLYDAATQHWDKMLEPTNDLPDLPGAAVVELHGPLYSGWISDFSRAIRNVVEDP